MQSFFRALCLCLAMLAGSPAAAAESAPAPIPIVVFSAYACPYCAQSQKILAQLQEKYPGRLRLTYKHFPLGRDAQALLPHLAAVAAAGQGRQAAMHEALFGAAPGSLNRTQLRALAGRLKLDQKRFLAALDAASTRTVIDDDLAEAQALKVNATPTFYIEGFKLEGLHQAEVFERIIEHRLAPAQQGGPR